MESVFLGPGRHDWAPVRYSTVGVGIVTYALIVLAEIALAGFHFTHTPFPAEVFAAVVVAKASSRYVGVERMPHVVFGDFISERRRGGRRADPASEVHIRARIRVQPREHL
jgi:hypothetical protein